MHIEWSEILVILFIALLVIKPERLPEVAAFLGRGVKWIRDTLNQLKQVITRDSFWHE